MTRVIAAAFIVAMLAVPTVVNPAAAAPTCDGRPATIVGTNGRNTIRGTRGPDVIVGKGGNDKIHGRGGRDRICGGTGSDLIEGDSGNDRLFGGSGDDGIVGEDGHDDLFGFDGDDLMLGGVGDDFARGGEGDDLVGGEEGTDVLKGDDGDDTVAGGAGNDDIDGGAGSDECDQQGGTGPVTRCETADFSVTVDCPPTGGEGQNTCSIQVTNDGPDAASYFLSQTEDGDGVECNGPDGTTRKPVLASGQARLSNYTMDCHLFNDADHVTVLAEVLPQATDPDTADNSAQDTIAFP
jgi:hypothetical protein